MTKNNYINFFQESFIGGFLDKIGINRNLETEKIEECKLNSNLPPVCANPSSAVTQLRRMEATPRQTKLPLILKKEMSGKINYSAASYDPLWQIGLAGVEK
ncbi:MAG: hypothetical protein ISS80_02555 [Candidatus Cloacimonetes bacterium]|nr:hypothetical protein [Candidatus Cloacimonadota bacterium]